MEPVNKYVNNSHLAVYFNQSICDLICKDCLTAETQIHYAMHCESLAVDR